MGMMRCLVDSMSLPSRFSTYAGVLVLSVWWHLGAVTTHAQDALQLASASESIELAFDGIARNEPPRDPQALVVDYQRFADDDTG